MGAERWPQSRADTEAVPNPIGSFFARRRFRPTLWPTLGVAALVAATVGLGNWQRHRGLEKEALREQYERAARQSPLELTGVSADAAALRFRPVRASGVFDGRRQVLIDNKVYRGRPGFDVVTPLKLASGDRYVLVDRGWIALGSYRSELPQVPPPRGRSGSRAGSTCRQRITWNSRWTQGRARSGRISISTVSRQPPD